MRANFFALMIMMCGCSRAPREAPFPQAWAQPTILDRVLAKADYSNALVQAERDLPADKWRTNFFGPENLSRDDRESAVGEAMIATIKPRLKDMNVTELIKSLKAMPYPDCVISNCYYGVAGYVYYVGNQMIIDEMKGRPTNELQVLRSLATDRIEVYRGNEGPLLGRRLNEVINEILGEKPKG